MDEFIAPRQATVDAGELTDFEETELAGETEVFGNVAHRLSGYAKRGTLNGEAFAARGVITDPVRAHAGRLADQRDGLGRRARRARRPGSPALKRRRGRMAPLPGTLEL